MTVPVTQTIAENGVNGVANGVDGGSRIKTSHPNPSLLVTADHQIKMAEAPVEEPGPGDVLLHIKATGICGYVEAGRVCGGDWQAY